MMVKTALYYDVLRDTKRIMPGVRWRGSIVSPRGSVRVESPFSRPPASGVAQFGELASRSASNSCITGGFPTSLMPVGDGFG